jgi:hypothetical protein
VIHGRETERHDERERTRRKRAKPVLAAPPVWDGREDGEHRERAQQNAVGCAVHDPAPDDLGTEGCPLRMRRACVLEDDGRKNPARDDSQRN